MRYEDVQFLDVDDVVALHKLALDKDGGLDGIRDPGMLASALGRARQTIGGDPLYGSLASMAMAYIYGIAMNHAFNDGNKRTAFIVGLTFLELNGYPLKLGREWERHIVELTLGRLAAGEIERMLAAAMGSNPTIT